MYQPAVQKYSVPYKGEPKWAFAIARTTLLSLSFEILKDTDNELVAKGPGMHSNQQPDLLGVTHFHITIDSGRISVEATLGGVTRMKNFVVFFPPLLVLFVFGVGNLFAANPESWSLFLMVVPWIIIGPFIAKSMESKTRKSVEMFIRSMSQARSND